MNHLGQFFETDRQLFEVAVHGALVQLPFKPLGFPL